jgi:putative ABC transport system ATP-binding protein
MQVVLEQISKIYNLGEANQVVALDGISLSVASGEMVCLQGPSGSGKTTLLSILGCVLAPTSGRATIGDKRISRLPDHFLTSYRRQLVGFVFQHFNLLPDRTVLDNVTLPLLPMGLPPKARRQRAMVLLEQLAIDHRRDFPVRQLSGGEQQRTAIARALIFDPPLLVADEPTAHLDAGLSLEIMAILTALKTAGKTIVIASHDPLIFDHAAIDRTLTLTKGAIAETTSSARK